MSSDEEYGFGYGDEEGYGDGEEEYGGGYDSDAYSHFENKEGNFEQSYGHKIASSERNPCTPMRTIKEGESSAQYRMNLEPDERFRDDVYKEGQKMIDNNNLNMTEEDLKNICRLNIPKIEYLNASAFILAYYVTGSGDINKRYLKQVFSILNKITDNSVKKPDIIRYARFIIERKIK